MSNSWLESTWGIQTSATFLVDALPKEVNVYVLIESALMPEWQQALYQHINDADTSPPYFESLFKGTAYQHIEHGPVLIEVTAYPQLLQFWVTQFETQPLGCVLVTPSDQTHTNVVNVLRHRLTVSRNDNPTLMRYYEPRMLLPFLAALSDEEKAMLFPSVQSIHWYHKQWFQAAWTPQPVRHASLTPWVVTPAHSHTMIHIMNTRSSQEVSA